LVEQRPKRRWGTPFRRGTPSKRIREGSQLKVGTVIIQGSLRNQEICCLGGKELGKKKSV